METKSSQGRTPSSIVADEYSISEPEVIASGCGHFVQRLCGDWRELLIGLRALGPLRLQVRNDLVSQEILGLMDPMSALDRRLFFISGENSLSLEVNRLQLGFLVREPEHSHYNAIYFFDLDGSPVLVIRIPEESFAFPRQLFSRFIHPNQAQDQPVVDVSRNGMESNWPHKELEQLRQGWSKLISGEGILSFLEQNGISYYQLLKMLGEPLARPLPVGSLRILLEVGMDHILPFRILSHGAGSVMNWCGEISKISLHDPMLHAKGIGMNFCCVEQAIEQGWLVTLPGADTPSRAEFFDPQGRHLVTITVPHLAKRHYDQSWRNIVEILVTLDLY